MNSSNYAGLAWPAIFIVATSIYGYWAMQRELVSSRPATAGIQSVPEPVPPPGIRSFHSRMWQDPLSASYEHYRALPPEQQQQSADRKTVLDVDLDQYLVESTARKRHAIWEYSVDRAEQNQTQNQMTKRPKHLSQPEVKLQQDDDSTPANESSPRAILEKQGSPPSERHRAMQHFFSKLVGKNDMSTLCLPVFLPSGPYAEDKEDRMRIRYAVVTALAEAGYHLKLNRRMSYVTPRVFVRVMWGWQEREIVVPVKLYRLEQSGKEHKQQAQVVVLWIDESELGERPLLATHRILNQLFATVEPEDQQKFRVAMVGPTSSDDLHTFVDKAERLYQDSDESDANSKRRLSIDSGDFQHWFLSNYHCVALAGNHDNIRAEASIEPMTGFMPLLSPAPESKKPELFSPRATKAGLLDFPEGHFIKLHRCIGNDKSLAELVYRELDLRGIFPGNVVLITEHDTGYGRAIGKTYESVFHDLNEGNDRKITFQSYAMLRGIDGQLPGDRGEGETSSKIKKSGYSTDLPEIVERRPEGRRQYDYMRRLARRIKQQPDVNAIGILGSDVYDKLLVLRALKPQFPDCVFFTTDLDALYGHSTERQHARNLLIASHYSLSLHKGLQKATAPFRDSYQTATFLATKLAVENHHGVTGDTGMPWSDIYHDRVSGVIAPTLDQPLMCVVGKSSIHRLPDVSERQSEMTKDAENPITAVHPEIVRNGMASHYLFVLSVVVLMVAICWVLLNRDRVIGSPVRYELRNSTVRYSLLLLLVVGVVLACVFLLRGKLSLERAPFLAGYSTWPTKFLYSLIGIISVLTCGHLIHHWCRKLDRVAQTNDRLGTRSARCFQVEHTVKLGLLAVVLIYIAGLFAYRISSHHFWHPALIAFVMIGGVWVYWTKHLSEEVPVLGGGDESPPAGNLVIGSDLRRCFGFALLFMVGVTIAASVTEWERGDSAQNGWFPEHFSRGEFSREGDQIANLYAFGAVILLFGSLLYFHLWCREFARYALDRPEDDELIGKETMLTEFGGADDGEGLIEEAKYERDRLWTVGQLSGVAGRFGPALLGLLFLLVIGFHPYFSPVAMPTSLLVVATLLVVVFVISTLSLRWHFYWERQRVLSRLDRKLRKYLEATSKAAEPEDSDSIGPSKRISTQPPIADRVEALMDFVRPYGSEATAAATLTTAVMPREKTSKGPDVISEIATQRERITSLSDGVFRSWNQSPMGWILGGSATIALVDLWIRAWTIGV